MCHVSSWRSAGILVASLNWRARQQVQALVQLQATFAHAADGIRTNESRNCGVAFHKVPILRRTRTSFRSSCFYQWFAQQRLNALCGHPGSNLPPVLVWDVVYGSVTGLVRSLSGRAPALSRDVFACIQVGVSTSAISSIWKASPAAIRQLLPRVSVTRIVQLPVFFEA